MDLQWEDLPVPDSPFFTREQYDKYSLAPNIKELWGIAQSPVEKGNAETRRDGGDAQVNTPQTPQDSSTFTNTCSSTAEEEEEGEEDRSNCDSDVTENQNHDDNKKTKKKGKNKKVFEKVDFPEPRLPYPCVSSLTVNDQKTYLYVMMSKTPREPPQQLKAQVHNEVAEFMNYLHNVAKLCPDDYNYISPGALTYSEDFFVACIQEHLASLPHLYQICEMTSLTGGTFDQGLTLNFEKQLLIMGSVDIGDHEIVAADAQLATDYQSVSSRNPAAKKARDKCAPISSDGNAEKLSDHYEPHVCLTQDALVTLLDNHGPEFCTPWELPVWVKVNPDKATQRKTVYIDSPLLKTEVTAGERSLVFHEESLKLSLNNHGKKNIILVMTEIPAAEKLGPPPEHSKRGLAASGERGLDFSDVNLTDLETFGDTTTGPLKEHKTAAVHKDTISGGGHASEKSMAKEASLSSQEEEQQQEEEMEEENITPTDMEDAMKEGQLTREPAAYSGDSEDERLVIDDPSTPAEPKTTATSSSKDRGPVTSTPAPGKVRQKRGGSKMAGVPGDQLGEILRMQSAMLKPKAKVASKGPLVVALGSFSPPPSTGRANPTSLVKPCVTSYLESQNQDGEGGSAAVIQHASSTAEHKKLLPEHLQEREEDVRDYEAPEEGNLLYKLYSLHDMLLAVRSSLSLTYARANSSGINRYVPVHVLPKLEHQLSYGVECLSSSQACQLWAHSLLHSSTISYVAHINAHTSKVALLRKLSDDWKQKLSCDFRPSKSLNILHHMLKKLTGLEEGRYVIGHKAGEPFVTIYKAGPSEKVMRGTYDLQRVHGSPPQPSPGLAPWLPVDPAVVLPFHRSHWRVPCTFPPRALHTTRKGNCGPNQSTNSRTRNPGPAKTSTTAQKNKKRRAAAKRKKLNSKNT